VRDVAVAPLGAEFRRLVARARGSLGAGCDGPPRQRDVQARIHRADVQRDRGLHVEDGGILGCVRHLEDRNRPVVLQEQERPVPLAAEVAGVGRAHAERRRGDSHRRDGVDVWFRAGQRGVDAERHGRERSQRRARCAK
jgi:hypothetical protein